MASDWRSSAISAWVKTPVDKDLVAVLSRIGWRPPDRTGSDREPRRWRGLHDPCHLGERLPELVVRVVGRLGR